MKLKIALISATALGMLIATGAAYAGSNNTAVVDQSQTDNSASIAQDGDPSGSGNISKIVQDGDNNATTVTQDGSNNWAGTHVQAGYSDPNETARGYNYMIQDGNDNVLTIDQSNKGNTVAYDGHLEQNGNHNDAEITQVGGASAGGNVNTLVQNGGTATSLANKVVINQSGALAGTYAGVNPSDYHYADEHILTVTQTNTGGSANKLTLTQTGGVYQAGNTIASVVQNGTGNTGTVTQSGRSNYLASLSQTGAGNTATVSLTGDLNGSAGGAFNSADALAVGIGQAIVTQDGGDTASYTATGNSNLYGIVQTNGTGNIVLGIVNGDSNDAAVKQNGAGNITDFTQNGSSNDLGVLITGSNNGVGAFRSNAGVAGVTNGAVDQEGNNNAASVTITGDNANYGMTQTGGGNIIIASLTGSGSHDNNLAIKQTGSDYASVAVVGSQNVMGVTQKSSGTGTNKLLVSVTGDLNNWALGGFSGVAATAGLTPGQIVQDNTGTLGQNLIDLTVTSDSNLFAFDQEGSNDSITGTVSGSVGNNQVAVVQNGGSNTAAFTQSGNGNKAVIQQ